VRFGVATSLAISRTMHAGTVLAMTAITIVAPLGPIHIAGVVAVAALLVYEQSLVSATDLSRVKRAFDLNGYVGLLYFAMTAAAVYLG
jgi:4-hydroxybenzoate polyprenyltransferase